MDFINDFDIDVSYVLNRCEEIVLEYPANIKDKGYIHLEKLHLLKGRNQSGGFCYLMPFWLMDTFKLGRDLCRKIAIGNTFGLLYFMSQDNIMDNILDEPDADILPLSSLFFMDFVSIYRSIFSNSSGFWNYFDRYMKEWAESVVWERKNHLGIAKDYTPEDLILLSRKAAPMKIPFAAMCIIAGQDSLVNNFSNMIDYDQIVYQIIDDWRDWREDLTRGSYTYLLMQVMKYCGLNDPSQLDEAHVKKAIYVGEVAEKVFEIAKKYNKLSLKCIKNLDSPYLRKYISLEESTCNKILEKIRDERGMMYKGGLDSLLWDITKK